MIRANLAAFLRRLGCRCFIWADRIQPDAITDALDVAYPSPPSNTQAGATIPVRSPSDDLRWVKPKDDEARAWSGAEIAAELREIRGTLKPWTPERPTTFKRKQRAQR